MLYVLTGHGITTPMCPGSAGRSISPQNTTDLRRSLTIQKEGKHVIFII